MNFPKRPDGPAVYDGKSYSAAVHLAEDVKPFVAIDNGLRDRGLSAPEIHHADIEAGFLITEDFGIEGVIEGDPPAPMTERYEAATDMLAALHREQLPETLPLAPQTDYAIPVFDIDAWLVEIGLMIEWYLPDRGAPLSDAPRAEFIAMWRELLQKPAAAARTWVLRDFHSPNLIWLGGREGIKRVGIIDFQDAVLGPPSYDVVSLLQDARIDIPEMLELSLLSRYIKARREPTAASTLPNSPRTTPSCRRSATRACSAPSRGSTGATASRNICVTSPASGPISAARWRIRRWRPYGPGMRRMCRRRLGACREAMRGHQPRFTDC